MSGSDRSMRPGGVVDIRSSIPRGSATDLMRAIGLGVADVVFPPRCAGCRRRGYWICPDCHLGIARFEAPLCDRCGMPFAVGQCRCDEISDAIAMHRSVAAYDGWLRSAIRAFKYGEESARARHLAAELASIVPSVGPIDGLVPVPLHPARLRQRGFNQAALLAEKVSRTSGVPVVVALTRTRSTRQQVGLGATDRATNVRDAFAIVDGSPVFGRRLAVIDDVCTTGATLGACAEVLRVHGAREVVSFTLAREI